MSYPPIKIMHPGSIEFDGERGYTISGWSFDMGGRALPADWQKVYKAEIVAAVLGHMTTLMGRHLPASHPVSLDVELCAHRETNDLFQRLGVKL